VTANALRSYLKEKLPAYMIPGAYVMMESFPLNRNGKVDRRALPLPEEAGLELSANFEAPRTPVEQAMAGIWAEVLKRPRVGIHDSFFDLGGHSLLATQVISRVRKVFQVEIPLRQMFESPTLASLSASIEEALRAEYDLPSVPIGRYSANASDALS